MSKKLIRTNNIILLVCLLASPQCGQDKDDPSGGQAGASAAVGEGTGQSASSDAKEDEAPTQPATTWTQSGRSYTVGGVLAKPDTSPLGAEGLSILFVDSAAPTCTDGTLSRSQVKVFFPSSGSGYGKPISVAFRNAEGQQIQESGTAGYPGALVSVSVEAGKTVEGWVRIGDLSVSKDSSIVGTFTAQSCP